MRERISDSGMPPQYTEVLGKRTIYQTAEAKVEYWYLPGYRPDLGKPVQGWTGQETRVTRVCEADPEAQDEWLCKTRKSTME